MSANTMSALSTAAISRIVKWASVPDSSTGSRGGPEDKAKQRSIGSKARRSLLQALSVFVVLG